MIMIFLFFKSHLLRWKCNKSSTGDKLKSQAGVIFWSDYFCGYFFCLFQYIAYTVRLTQFVGPATIEEEKYIPQTT